MKRLDNAVLDNTLTTRFRNWRPVLLVTLYNLLIIGVIIFIMGYMSVLAGTDTNTSGVVLFDVLVFFQFAMIVLIMPALTSGLISGEKERKTLDLLLCTQMTPLGIILGKLLSGCLFMVLCVICSIPMITMAYLYGGVSVLSILSIVACYLATIIAVGSLGIFFSTILKRTTAAVVVSYLAVFIIGAVSTVGGYIDLSVQSIVHQTLPNFYPAYPVLWIFNPVIALIEIVSNGGISTVMGSLMGTPGQGIWPSMWGWECLALLVISAILIYLSALILSPRKGWQAWKKAHAPKAVIKA